MSKTFNNDRLQAAAAVLDIATTIGQTKYYTILTLTDGGRWSPIVRNSNNLTGFMEVVQATIERVQPRAVRIEIVDSISPNVSEARRGLGVYEFWIDADAAQEATSPSAFAGVDNNTMYGKEDMVRIVEMETRLLQERGMAERLATQLAHLQAENDRLQAEAETLRLKKEEWKKKAKAEKKALKKQEKPSGFVKTLAGITEHKDTIVEMLGLVKGTIGVVGETLSGTANNVDDSRLSDITKSWNHLSDEAKWGLHQMMLALDIHEPSAMGGLMLTYQNFDKLNIDWRKIYQELDNAGIDVKLPYVPPITAPSYGNQEPDPGNPGNPGNDGDADEQYSEPEQRRAAGGEG